MRSSSSAEQSRFRNPETILGRTLVASRLGPPEAPAPSFILSRLSPHPLHNVAMKWRPLHWTLPVLAVGPIVLAFGQQTPAEPTCEQVYKDIQVFTGVPAKDLIPAMEFMSASLKVPCTGCHEPNDYAAPTKGKIDGRTMVLLQRDINDKWFNGRLEVTCMSCHNGQKKPTHFPVPATVAVSHELPDVEAEPQDLFDKHLAAVGKAPASITFTGTLEAPNDQTHKPETLPLELIQAGDGRFRFVSGTRRFGFDGKQVWYYGNVLTDEPAAILSRVGRSWRGPEAFAGLASPALDGMGTVGKSKVLIVRASRPSSGSIEDLYFDRKSGLLVRMVNVKRSSIGQVISSIDYSDYKSVGGVKAPMKVVISFGSGEVWTLHLKSAKAESSVDEAVFKVGGGG